SDLQVLSLYRCSSFTRYIVRSGEFGRSNKPAVSAYRTEQTNRSESRISCWNPGAQKLMFLSGPAFHQVLAARDFLWSSIVRYDRYFCGVRRFAVLGNFDFS